MSKYSKYLRDIANLEKTDPEVRELSREVSRLDGNAGQEEANAKFNAAVDRRLGEYTD